MSTLPYSGTVPSPALFTDLPPLTVHEYVPPRVSTDPAQQAREAHLQSLLGSRVRIAVTDGRTYEGVLYCIDNLANVMITEYHRVVPPEDNPRGVLRAPAMFAAMADIVSVKVLASSIPKKKDETAVPESQ